MDFLELKVALIQAPTPCPLDAQLFLFLPGKEMPSKACIQPCLQLNSVEAVQLISDGVNFSTLGHVFTAGLVLALLVFPAYLLLLLGASGLQVETSWSWTSTLGMVVVVLARLD